MYQILKMRLPTKEEWDHLVTITGGDDNIIHCKNIYSWGQDASPTRPSDRITLGLYSGATWSYYPSDVRDSIIGFRPVFEVAGGDDVPDGEIVPIGTLYVYGYAIKIPETREQLCGYMPGASVSVLEPLSDYNHQVRAIKVGKVFIADRVLLNRVSWDDLQTICKPTPEIESVRLPTVDEWTRLTEVAEEACVDIHWEKMFSWCKEMPRNREMASWREIRGFSSARGKDCGYAANRSPNIGFRPVFELVNPNTLADGAVTVAGTLYMGGLPVKVSDGIPDYDPEANLEFREALDNPDYQIRAIKVGSILIADRVLLKNISWFSTREAYVRRPGKDICTWKVPVVTVVSVEANSAEEALTIASRKADNMGASLRYQTPEEYLTFLNS